MSPPTLFENRGAFAPVAGMMWFGLLFFAGITSSLAMGQPVMAFLQDELGVRRSRAALAFGTATLLLGGIAVCLYPGGAHDEVDFLVGDGRPRGSSPSASPRSFGWVFGIDRRPKRTAESGARTRCRPGGADDEDLAEKTRSPAV